MRFRRITWILIGIPLLISGCAICRYDSETGTQHIYGIGHMSMRGAGENDNKKAVVFGMTTVGLSVGEFFGERQFSVGVNDQRRVSVGSNSDTISLSWPNNSFSKLEVGFDFKLPAMPAGDDLGKEEQ